MGKCLEFAVTITAGCEHPMVAESDCCACAVCGTRCTGRFDGCPAVWAATAAPDPSTMAGNGADSAPPAVALAAIEADLAIDWASDAPAPVVAHDPQLEHRSHRGRSQRRQRRRLGAVAAAVAIAGAGLGVVLATSGGADSNGVGVDTVRPPELQFKTVAISDTVDLERNWRLEGTAGNRFIGTLTFSNSADTVSSVVYDETLPKSLADNVNVVLFDPYPIVINPDPVFEYQLSLDPHASATVTYEISVPPDGADPERLDAWAKDVEKELAQNVADAEAALAAAKTAEEQAAARAFLEAAQAAQHSFKPTPHAPGCTYCDTAPSGGGGGGGATIPTTAPREKTPTTNTLGTTTSSDSSTTSSSDAPPDSTTTPTTTCDQSPEGCPPPP